MKQRKHFTKEFKLDAVGLVTDQSYSQAEASRCFAVRCCMFLQVIN